MNKLIIDMIAKATSGSQDISYSGGVNDHEIAEAILGLHLKLPEDYLEFLKSFGTLTIPPIEIYGMVAGKGASGGIPNAFPLTREELTNGLIPPETVIIGYTGFGPAYLLDCTSNPLTHGSVSEWNYGNQMDENAERFPSFSEFLRTLLKERECSRV